MVAPNSNKADRSVQAVERTVAILDAFLKTESPLSLGELAEQSKLFKSVVSRYLLTLVPRGYINIRSDGRYEPGPKLYELGCRFANNQDLSQLILPTLEALVDQTQESASFYIRDGESRICLFRKDSPHPIKASIAPGTRMPLDDSATAQVLRTFKTQSVTSWDIQSCIFVSSFALNDITKKLLPTVSVSAPLCYRDGSFAGALTISGPPIRFEPSNPSVQQLLIKVAQELSAQLISP
ncbi:IclR family transcriptional regulator [Orrella sp. 11846]|uniref:IclR family transcriptional regulator n=1 Tax=Orrella sp. 11846 TaxID=3409913 RepID=UPI003B5BF241